LSRNIIPELDAVVEKTKAFVLADPKFRGVFDGSATRASYIEFLSQTYHYLKQTPLTLRTAVQTLTNHPNPIYRQVRDRFVHHEQEEEGHEDWVLNDIRALGGDVEAVKKMDPCPAVKAYVAESAFIATSRQAIAVMGLAYLLEGLAQQLGLMAVDNLKSRSGIPNIEKAVTFLKGHGHLDQRHMEELRQVVAAITDDDDKDAIVTRAKTASNQYTHLLHYSSF